ncbi:MAG: hypothetical protein PHU75_11135 [Candidatus Nanopelagicales bacterium]|nr:hypothetical protein [Candidatus Nanopelagicales bacterium]
MIMQATLHSADLAVVQVHYTSTLIARSRRVVDAREAAQAHAECWNHTLEHADTRAIFLSLPANEIQWLRDARLARIAAEHYGFALADLLAHAQ